MHDYINWMHIYPNRYNYQIPVYRGKTHIYKASSILEKFTNTFCFSDNSIRMTEVRQSERAWNSCLLFYETQMFSQRIACSVQISQGTFFASIFPCSMWEMRMFSQVCICPAPFLCSHADLKAEVRGLGWAWPVSSGVFSVFLIGARILSISISAQVLRLYV